MSLPPEFKSSIPNHLLENSSERDKYIIEQLSIIGQKSDWLIGETRNQSEDIKVIKTETKTTNGKIARAITDINDLQKKEAEKLADWTEVKQIVTMKQFIEKYLVNKYVLICAGIFLLGLFKILLNEDLRGILFSLMGLG